MSEEGSEDNPRTGVLNLPYVRHVKIRKRVDPATSSERKTYRIVRTHTFSLRGRRTHFQIYSGDEPLYHAKLKSKRQTEPIPIGNGKDVHYSSQTHAAYLLTNPDAMNFSLRARMELGSEIITVEHFHNNNDKTIPKTIKMNLFLKDSLIPQKLVSKMPIASDDGEWVLDFHDKNVIPSIKNVIMIGETSPVEFLVVRKVDDDIVEADAVPVMSALATFGFVLTLFIAKS